MLGQDRNKLLSQVLEALPPRDRLFIQLETEQGQKIYCFAQAEVKAFADLGYRHLTF